MALIKANSSCRSMMLLQELLYTTQGTGLPMRPAAVRAGTTEPVRTSLRARCPYEIEESTAQSNILFSLGSLILTPLLLTQDSAFRSDLFLPWKRSVAFIGPNKVNLSHLAREGSANMFIVVERGYTWGDPKKTGLVSGSSS